MPAYKDKKLDYGIVNLHIPTGMERKSKRKRKALNFRKMQRLLSLNTLRKTIFLLI